MTEPTYQTANEAMAAAFRRARLLADLAAEGSARCDYAPGCMSPEAWVTATCDCKYFLGSLPGIPVGEETGCCEMRAAYRVLANND